MFDLDRWSEIWETINRNRKRSIMTAFGVFWGIFMLSVMAGMGDGLGNLFRSQLGDMAVNSCFFFGGRTSVPYHGFASGRRWQFDNDDIVAIRKQVPGVKHVAGMLRGRTTNFTYGDKTAEYSVMGYMPDYNIINPRTIVHGRYINDLDMEHRRKVCVIGTEIVKELFPGDENPVGKNIRMKNVYLTVVGVYVPQSNGVSFSRDETTVIVPFTTLQQFNNRGNKMDIVAITAQDDMPIDKFENGLKELFRQRHHIAPDDEKAINGFNLGEQFNQMYKLFTGINILTWIVGIGTLIAGIVGISNIMLVVVRERTQEIGVRRALGAPPRSIITQIMSESFVLTFLAGVVGLAAAVGLLSAIGSLFASMPDDGGGMSGLNPQISLSTAFGALFILIGGGLLAGIIPAIRAIRIKPVDAIREE